MIFVPSGNAHFHASDSHSKDFPLARVSVVISETVCNLVQSYREGNDTYSFLDYRVALQMVGIRGQVNLSLRASRVAVGAPLWWVGEVSDWLAGSDLSGFP